MIPPLHLFMIRRNFGLTIALVKLGDNVISSDPYELFLAFVRICTPMVRKWSVPYLGML